jgi:hypothetical protein
MPYRMYDVCKKKAWGVLGARRQNLARLRVEKLGCAGSRQIIPAIFVHPKEVPSSIEEVSGRQMGPDWPPEGSSPVNRLSPSSPVPPGQAVPSLYLPKTAFAALANLQSEDLAL